MPTSGNDEGRVTQEVGDEGGTPGDLELTRQPIGIGSEASETWRPVDDQEDEIKRDDTGQGRRSP